MNNNCMPADHRDCPHCNAKDSLAYYHEVGRGIDIYYCQRCFSIVEWDGIKISKTDGEAYPDREKKNE